MTTGQGVMLFAALLNMGVGVYMTFVSGETMGPVFIAVGATFAALTGVVGKKSKAQKDETDAG
ncbi:MAG: hypothetical protein AAF559_00590 [Pseudomonadota bacterium]